MKNFLRSVAKIGAIVAVFSLCVSIGSFALSSNTVTYAEGQTVTVEAAAPILDRIADCESGTGKAGSGSQIGKNGQTIIHVNDNNTVDVGKWMINYTYWGAEASKLGYNLFTEEGNHSMAKWLYANKGTGDWAASQACWKR